MSSPKIPYLFPKWRAAAAQVGTHGAEAFSDLEEAAKPHPPAERLDAMARAVDSFDHAVVDSQGLPLARNRYGRYYDGYRVAKAGLALIVGSGVIPGAAERIGKQDGLMAQRHLHDGVQLYGAEGKNTISRLRSVDWMGHAMGDAKTALTMLKRPELAQPLMSGLGDVRASMTRKRPVDPTQVARLDALFGQLTTAFDTEIAAAQREWHDQVSPRDDTL